jgi:hypothetical protein
LAPAGHTIPSRTDYDTSLNHDTGPNFLLTREFSGEFVVLSRAVFDENSSFWIAGEHRKGFVRVPIHHP